MQSANLNIVIWFLLIWTAAACAVETKYTNEIKFIFYNGSTIHDYKLFNYSSALNIHNETYFNGSLPTVFYLHGWSEKPLTNGTYTTNIITEGFYRNPNNRVNLIVLDYSSLVPRYIRFPFWTPRLVSEFFGYFTAVLNARHIGEAMGNFLTNFVPACNCLSNIHMIGFSIGAQILSFTAKTFGRGRIPRITGLEPALPPYEARLQPFLTSKDAKFVDIVHTDSGILGFWESVGTVDFRPNGGYRLQPNCKITDSFECSHYSSAYFFATSIYEPQLFLAKRCHNVLFWKLGLCHDNDIAQFGYFAQPDKKGNYYFRTQAQYPYGLGVDGLK